MGMKDWLDRIQKNAADKLQKEQDPAEQRKQKKEENAKAVNRAAKLVKTASEAVKTYNKAAKKVDEISTDVTKKTIEIAEKAKPMADKVDQTTGNAGKYLKGAFSVIKNKVSKGADEAGKQVGKKVDQIRDEQSKKPSTGSGLLDFLAPAVPETEATKPKKKPDAPKPPNAG